MTSMSFAIRVLLAWSLVSAVAGPLVGAFLHAGQAAPATTGAQARTHA